MLFTIGVYFCAEINFPGKFQKIHQKYIFIEDSRSPKDSWRGVTGPPGHQVGARRGPWPRLEVT